MLNRQNGLHAVDCVWEGVVKWFSVFGRQVAVKISSDWDGYDCGLLNIGVTKRGNTKALRIVIWRLALWIEL